MSDSDRVGHEVADSVERLLLRAGRVAAPRGAKERSLAAVSTALAGAFVTSHAAAGATIAGAGGAAGAAKAGSLTMLHVIAVTGLTGIGAVSGAMIFDRDHHVAPPSPASVAAPSSAAPKSVARTRPTRPAVLPPALQPPPPIVVTDDPPAANSEQSAAVARAAVATVETKTPARAAVPLAVEGPPSTVDSPAPVRVEIAMLDQARRALSLGEPARSLSILDAYVERFPRGTLAPEATLVRIEALIKAGDRPAAERAAEALEASRPDNPYGARVRSLLASPNR